MSLPLSLWLQYSSRSGAPKHLQKSQGRSTNVVNNHNTGSEFFAAIPFDISANGTVPTAQLNYQLQQNHNHHHHHNQDNNNHTSAPDVTPATKSCPHCSSHNTNNNGNNNASSHPPQPPTGSTVDESHLPPLQPMPGSSLADVPRMLNSPDETWPRQGVPRIIHQMWLDRVDPDSTGPRRDRRAVYSKYTATWINKHPGWKYVMWNRRMVDALFAREPCLAEFRHFYENDMKEHIEKCDFARYAVLYACGGVYADLDFECLRSFESLRDGGKRGLGWAVEPREHWANFNRAYERDPERGLLYNGVIMSAPGHPVWRALLHHIIRTYKIDGPVLLNTGPANLWEFAHANPELVRDSFIHTALFIPINGWHEVSTALANRRDLADQVFCSTLWNEGTGW